MSTITLEYKVTIHTVAERAGVGVGTVSRVINDSPLVSEETKTRVMQVIKELGYTPNLAARQLRRSTARRMEERESPRGQYDLIAAIYANIHNFLLQLKLLTDVGRRGGIDPRILELMEPVEREVSKLRDELSEVVSEMKSRKG